MLKLNNVEIYLQNIGTVLAVFLKGEKQDIKYQYYSFYNHEATNSDCQWWTDNLAMFWCVPIKGIDVRSKFINALKEANLASLMNKYNVDEGPLETATAQDMAAQQYESIEWVSWRHADKITNLNANQVCVNNDKEKMADDIICTTNKNQCLSEFEQQQLDDKTQINQLFYLEYLEKQKKNDVENTDSVI